MELHFEYYVVEFLHQPYIDVERLVVVPACWMKANVYGMRDRRVAVAYPAEHSPHIIRYVREKTTPHRDWAWYCAVVKFGNDDFREAELFLIKNSWYMKGEFDTNNSFNVSSDNSSKEIITLENRNEKKPTAETKRPISLSKQVCKPQMAVLSEKKKHSTVRNVTESFKETNNVSEILETSTNNNQMTTMKQHDDKNIDNNNPANKTHNDVIPHKKENSQINFSKQKPQNATNDETVGANGLPLFNTFYSTRDIYQNMQEINNYHKTNPYLLNSLPVPNDIGINTGQNSINQSSSNNNYLPPNYNTVIRHEPLLLGSLFSSSNDFTNTQNQLFHTLNKASILHAPYLHKNDLYRNESATFNDNHQQSYLHKLCTATCNCNHPTVNKTNTHLKPYLQETIKRKTVMVYPRQQDTNLVSMAELHNMTNFTETPLYSNSNTSKELHTSPDYLEHDSRKLMNHHHSSILNGTMLQNFPTKLHKPLHANKLSVNYSNHKPHQSQITSFEDAFIKSFSGKHTIPQKNAVKRPYNRKQKNTMSLPKNKDPAESLNMTNDRPHTECSSLKDIPISKEKPLSTDQEKYIHENNFIQKIPNTTSAMSNFTNPEKDSKSSQLGSIYSEDGKVDNTTTVNMRKILKVKPMLTDDSSKDVPDKSKGSPQNLPLNDSVSAKLNNNINLNGNTDPQSMNLKESNHSEIDNTDCDIIICGDSDDDIEIIDAPIETYDVEKKDPENEQDINDDKTYDIPLRTKEETKTQAEIVIDLSDDEITEEKSNDSISHNNDDPNTNMVFYKSNYIPKFKRKSSKWTLKYQRYSPGLVELISGSCVYINEMKLNKCLVQAKNYNQLARMLMLEIFSLHALSVCSFAGGRDRYRETRPNLDEGARLTLLEYIEEHGRANGWGPINVTDIKGSMRNKINKIRAKYCSSKGMF